LNERWLHSIFTTEKAACNRRKYVCVNVGCTYIYSEARKKRQTDRWMPRTVFFSSGIVIIFVVRHAAKNKQLKTGEYVCVLFSRICFDENIIDTIYETTAQLTFRNFVKEQV
jgi:hypothetical protein